MHTHASSLAQHNPLLPLMQFHEEFLLRCDLEQCMAHLRVFELSMDQVCVCVADVMGNIRLNLLV